MGDIKREDYFGIDNDASASSFGWNFQYNAAIYLAINYSVDLERIKVESSLQDIDITLKNNNKVLAQAKSTTDYTKYGKDKQRVYDAFLSLAIAQKKRKDATLIYITNIPDFFDQEYGLFNNKVVPYCDLPSAIITQIDDIFETIKSHIQKTINSASDDKKRDKFLFEKKCLDEFDKTKMAFCVIAPFHGDNLKNRYSVILGAISDFLSQQLKLGDSAVSRIKNQLLDYLQCRFEHNSTIKDDGSYENAISRKEFIWPVVALVTDYTNDISEKISSLCSFAVDQSFLERFEEAKNRIDVLRYERFEFANKVLYEYYLFKKAASKTDNIEESFIRTKFADFLEEFNQYGFDEQTIEFVTKWFLYLTLSKNNTIYEITRFLGDD